MNARTSQHAPERSGGAALLAGKYLTFRLAHEEYGIEIMKVQEIIGLMPVSKLPMVPGYVRGVINLRGRIVPTIDLRTKFGLKAVPDTEKTCIIVVEMKTKDDSINLGIVVDEVAEVLDVAPEEADMAPNFGDSLDTRYIRGIGLVNGAVKILLDIDQVLTGEEVGSLHSKVVGHTESLSTH